MRGNQVKNLQNRLNYLGYWAGAADGIYGWTTSQAVMALQKVNGLSRTGNLDSKTLSRLNEGKLPSARYGAAGRHIEVNKAKQIVLLVSGGKVEKVLNTSTGDGRVYYNKSLGRFRATTPNGSFKIYSHFDAGWQTGALGKMWRPAYFNGGIALHGSPSVPGYPASHGCCRLTPAAMNYLIAAGWVRTGTTVKVY